MNKKQFRYEVLGFIFVSITGTLNHFLFEWLNSSTVIGLFCPINESVWEHLKLLFFPYLLWTAAEFFWLQKQPNYFQSKINGVISGLIFIVAFFYTYSGITGTTSTFMDILSFFTGTAISFAVSYEFMRNSRLGSKAGKIISILLFLFIASLFFLFTFLPPLIPLFEDPHSFTFGI